MNVVIAAIIVFMALVYIAQPRSVTVEQIAMRVSDTTECVFAVSSAGGIEAMICDSVGALDTSRARWVGAQ
jgi:NhaP-type Na+/H+ and K+/H+ antiporter